MTGSIVRLWGGRIGMARAFWEYAIVYVSLINLVATTAAFVVLAAGGPGPLAVLIFLLPLPYNGLAVVGVWRSASRYEGPARWAHLARLAVVVWAVIATLS